MQRTTAAPSLILALICLLLVPGCSPPFPKTALDAVNRDLSFQDLRSDPDKYKDEQVLLGGLILSLKSLKEGTLLEILQTPLDAQGKPDRTDATGGRFLVRSAAALESAVYHPGRMVTLIARVIGRKELPIDEIVYLYPYLEAVHLHLWDYSSQPRFFIGIGVSGHI